MYTMGMAGMGTAEWGQRNGDGCNALSAQINFTTRHDGSPGTLRSSNGDEDLGVQDK